MTFNHVSAWPGYLGVFNAGLLTGAVIAALVLLTRRPRPRPVQATVLRCLRVQVRLTCDCGNQQESDVPYEDGMSEVAVTCDECGETLWMEVPPEVAAFLSEE